MLSNCIHPPQQLMGGFTSDDVPARRHWLFNLTSVGIESFGCCEAEIWKDAVYLFSALSLSLYSSQRLHCCLVYAVTSVKFVGWVLLNDYDLIREMRRGGVEEASRTVLHVSCHLKFQGIGQVAFLSKTVTYIDHNFRENMFSFSKWK